MRKRIIAGLLVVIAVFAMGIPVCAHESQKEHDQDLKNVMFGDEHKQLSGEASTAFQAIADAAALCIDQFSPNEESRWKERDFNDLQEELDKLGLPRLNVSFDAIDLNKATIHSEKNVTANTHRQYTHQGWNYKKHPDREFWQKRKDILRETANRVLFNPQPLLSWTPWLNDILCAPSEQCDAFCGMVYYIHILGDHIGGDTPEKVAEITPLIQYTSMSSPGIIVELQEQLDVMFASQKSSRTFQALEQELTYLKVKAEKNCGTWGSIDTIDKCVTNQGYAKELLDILSRAIPTLLKDEPFYKDRFL